MILVINGSFGIGKTTTGRILRRRLPGSVLFNPEWTGSVLMRLPIHLAGSGTDDFQDIDLWRRSVVKGSRVFRAISETVIMPMAFSRKDYFDEVIDGIRQFEDQIRIFCLRASYSEILNRLRLRGERGNSWAIRKAGLCVEAHKNDLFGERIDTTSISPEEVADEILKRIA